MIGYFPSPYEDELMYSWLARYYVYSGYTSAADAYLDLYENKNIRPSVELMNNMVKDAREVLSCYATRDDIIHKYTMFPEYACFIEPIKRERLLKEYDFTRGNWINNLMIPASKGERYLRYCPVCVEEDRNSIGETYWHRRHQINNIKICVRHCVYLQDSNIVINRNLTRLKAAEIVIPQISDIVVCKVDIIINLAAYMVKVFTSSKYSHDKIGRFLNNNIAARYIHNSGIRRMYDFYNDYKDYYRDLDDNDYMSINTMCRILGGRKGTFYNICQIALYENIDVSALLLHSNEDNNIFIQVSERTGEPLERVQLIGEAIIDELKNTNNQFIKKERFKANINKEDIRLLPKVKTVASMIYGEGEARPKNVSLSAICKAISVDSHRLKKMKRCMEVINQYYETQEHYWAREIVWAIRMIEKSGDTLNLSHIQDLTNFRHDNMVDCIRELKNHYSDDYLKIKHIL